MRLENLQLLYRGLMQSAKAVAREIELVSREIDRMDDGPPANDQDGEPKRT